MKDWLPKELEEIPCDLCGSKEVSRKFLRRDGMRVVECAVCGLAYLNPRPKEDIIFKFYGEDYFSGVTFDRGEGGLKCNLYPSFGKEIENEMVLPRPIVVINEKFGGFQSKNVLEIGCATGDLLTEIKKAGGVPSGIEISDFAVQIARGRCLDVKTGSVEDCLPEYREYFDIVMAFEVVEHVPSPSRFIKHCAEIIRPGGLLSLSTPNYACANRFGEQWVGFNSSFEHIYFFSLKVLKKMAMRSGLTLKYWETTKYLGGPSRSPNFWSLQKERLNSLSFFIKEIGLWKTVNAIFAKPSDSSYYPYGSGHTLLMVFENSAT